MTEVILSSAIADQVMIQRFMEKSKKKNTSRHNRDSVSDPVKKEQEKLRKKVTLLLKKQKRQQVRQIVKGQDSSKPWGQDAHVKVRNL